MREIQQIGAIVIGRNEGERLQRCLRSLVGRVSALVYVDSGSSDDSVKFARGLGVEVVALDRSVPFTAARARNEGFRRLGEIAPAIAFVQFVDGDCEVLDGWIEIARESLEGDPSIVAVTGLRRERYPDRSLYNESCNVEWRMGTFGETNRFGGDVMIRANALASVGGYDPRIIAAEDDEVALRLHEAGGKILRIDHEMTLHDAAIDRVSQWWQRATRTGHGYAQVSRLHSTSLSNKFKQEKRRVLIWGFALPTVLFALAIPSQGVSLLLAGLYPLRAVRIALRSRREGMTWRASTAWAWSCAFSSFPEFTGMARYHIDRARRRAPTIIEYKRLTRR